MENTPSAPRPYEPPPGLVARLRRWLISAALALVLAAIEVGEERPLRVSAPIILLREADFSQRFHRIRPYRAHYRRHSPSRRSVGSD